MPFRNYEFEGEEVWESWVRKGHKVSGARVLTALDAFMKFGLGTRACPHEEGAEVDREAWIVPSRWVLRGVPDAAALLAVDRRALTVRLLEIIDPYVESAQADWDEVVKRACASIGHRPRKKIGEGEHGNGRGKRRSERSRQSAKGSKKSK